MTRALEKGIATASFATAVALAFTSLLISDDHDIAANVLFVVAQFLTLTATLLGIDYKFNNGKLISAEGYKKQKSSQPNTDKEQLAGQNP